MMNTEMWIPVLKKLFGRKHNKSKSEKNLDYTFSKNFKS